MSTQPNHHGIVPGHRPGSEPVAGSGLSRAALAMLWLALVAVAVAGRAWQPAANVTPMAAVALVAGAVFPNPLIALSVPMAALAISNLFLPSYGSLALAVTVYAATAWPVVLGQFGLLGGPGRRTKWMAVAGGALASSLVFFFVTNAAHWLLTADYPRSVAGLVACLAAGLPFYRWMPVGDLAWSLGLFGCLAAANRLADTTIGLGLAPARLPQGRGDASA